jgi:hypothetical protein
MFLMNEGTGREQCVMTISRSNVLLQHFDRIIIEGVIVLFYLKCPSKSLYMQFFHFKCEFLKMVHACKLFWQFDRAILKNVI